MSIRRYFHLNRRTLQLRKAIKAASNSSNHLQISSNSLLSTLPPTLVLMVRFSTLTGGLRAASPAQNRWPKLKAVIFDLGGVVIPTPQPIFDQFEDTHSLERGSLVKTIQVKGDDGAFGRLERGEMSIEEFPEPFQTDYKDVTSYELTLEQTRNFINNLSDFTKLKPHSIVIDCIQWLRSKGIKVAILTNNFRWKNGETVFPKESIPGVDLVIQSCIKGLKKPDKAIFELTLAQLGVTAANTVFLDDLESNVSTARRMGMTTIKVGDVEAAMDRLRAIVKNSSYTRESHKLHHLKSF